MCKKVVLTMVFFCRAYVRGPCRCGQCPPDIDETEYVRAPDSDKAIEFLMVAYPKSKASWWTLYPIPADGADGIIQLIPEAQ